MVEQLEEPKLRMTCEECGSTHVTRDAWAEWDEDEQDWVLGAIYDYAFCHTCQSGSHIEEQLIEG
jgi:hypothetical protein